MCAALHRIVLSRRDRQHLEGQIRAGTSALVGRVASGRLPACVRDGWSRTRETSGQRSLDTGRTTRQGHACEAGRAVSNSVDLRSKSQIKSPSHEFSALPDGVPNSATSAAQARRSLSPQQIRGELNSRRVVQLPSVQLSSNCGRWCPPMRQRVLSPTGLYLVAHCHIADSRRYVRFRKLLSRPKRLLWRGLAIEAWLPRRPKPEAERRAIVVAGVQSRIDYCLIA
jgi:hypothetical protein